MNREELCEKKSKQAVVKAMRASQRSEISPPHSFSLLTVLAGGEAVRIRQVGADCEGRRLRLNAGSHNQDSLYTELGMSKFSSRQTEFNRPLLFPLPIELRRT